MSILIKMEMPKNCGGCPFFVETNKNSSAEKYYCQQLKDRLPIKGGIPQDCPLIELPPHGLIDKQMLLRNVADNQLAHFSVEEDYAFWNKVWDYINDAPTIIESEE